MTYQLPLRSLKLAAMMVDGAVEADRGNSVQANSARQNCRKFQADFAMPCRSVSSIDPTEAPDTNPSQSVTIPPLL